MLQHPRVISTYPLPLRQMAQECRHDLALEPERDGLPASVNRIVRTDVVRRVLGRRRRPPTLPRVVSRPGLGAARQAAVERFRLGNGCVPDAPCLRLEYAFSRVLSDRIGRRLAALGLSPPAIRGILAIVRNHRHDYSARLLKTLPAAVITDPTVIVWRVRAELCRGGTQPTVHLPPPEADWTAPIRTAVES